IFSHMLLLYIQISEILTLFPYTTLFRSSNRYKLITNVRSSLMAVNIHITIIELNALHTKRQNLFQELDAVIHLLMEAKHWGLRKSRNLFNNLIQRNQSAAFSSGKVRPNHETNINIIARRTGKDVNSHTVLDGIITTIMATIQRINIIGSREGSRN